MAMTKDERATIENIIKQLSKPNCGCSNGLGTEDLVKTVNDKGIEAVSRLYLDTWIIPALRLLLPGEQRDPKRARRISR